MKKLCRHYAKWDKGDIDGVTFQGQEYEILRVILNYTPNGGSGVEFVNSKGQLDRACASLFTDFRITNKWLWNLRGWFIDMFPNSPLALNARLKASYEIIGDLQEDIAELRGRIQSYQDSRLDAHGERDYAQSQELNRSMQKSLSEQYEKNQKLEGQIETLIAQLSIAEQAIGSLERRMARAVKAALKTKTVGRKAA